MQEKKRNPILEKKGKDELFKNTKEEFYFKLIDGSELKNLPELARSLEKMSDDVFYYHVNEQKNDFSNWVRDVFKEEKLADNISNCRNKLETEASLLRSLIRVMVK